MIHPSGKAIVTLRVGGALFCNVLLHAILLNIFMCFANADPTSPFLWIKNTLGSYFSLRMWLFALPLVLVTLAQGIVSCREYVLSPLCPSSRFAVLCSMFSIYNAVVCGLYAYIGFSVPLIYTCVIDNQSNSLTFSCDSGRCLSEESLVLLLGGTWMGIYYFIHNHLFRTRYLDFPFLQQRKSIIIKSSIIPTLKTSLKYSFTPIQLFLIIYYFWGNRWRELLFHFSGYKVYPGDLDSLLNLLSLVRLFKFWLFSTLTVFSMKMMEVMIRIYLMQRYEFSMFPSAVMSSNCFVLEEALSRADVPIIRYLGFWDLALLADNDMARRKEIFTLSQPGGHPYTWMGIKKQCFDAIDQFTLSLEAAIKKPPLKQNTSPSNISHTERQESTQYFLSTNSAKPLFCTETLSMVLRCARQSIINWILSKLVLAGESRPVRYLFGDVPSIRVNHLVLHSLPIAWAAESLSLLLSASLTEDSYGVLQADIPSVISTLLRLQSALDSLHKNSSSLSKINSDPSNKMLNTLISKVKRSLYHLAIHFKPFISDLQLSKNDEIRVLSYCSFRE